MQVFPAVDIRDGRCVRLLRGDFSVETVYGDPVEQALAFVADGASIVHVVDLDAARSGLQSNMPIISEIIRNSSVPVQVGGGIRDASRAAKLLDEGANRVVIGTLAVEDPEGACRLATSYPGQIVVGLDHRSEVVDGRPQRVVAVRGWEDSGASELVETLQRLEGAPFAATVITDISRDGTLSGPDLDGYRYVLSRTNLDVIASGGVGSTEDLRRLRDLEVAGRRLGGVIIGRALLNGTFSVKEAIDACRP